MSIRNLEYMFRPCSVALIGASNRPRSVGATVMKNLLAGGFDGPIMPVNPKYGSIQGVLAYPDVASLPQVPDMAVICTPPATVAGIISDLSKRGTKAAIVLTAGLDVTQSDGVTYQQAMLNAAHPNSMRILGPNCVGLVAPHVGLNASFAHATVKPGHIAFITQSGALATAVLDWAKSRDIGFSHFVSLGNSADVDFGDVIDFLGTDPATRSILLYVESIKHARKFMSAARAASRNKTVIVLKAGRVAEGAKAAASHTGALAGSDDVYDAAIRRAGMLRVYTIEDLFDAVETLGRAKPSMGDRLAILTNGGGPGVMATDMAIEIGARIATLSDETIKKLDAVLPPTWSHGNPVDIIGDAPGERYVAALSILQHDEGTDAILFLHAPTAISPSVEIAQAIIPGLKTMKKPVFASWLGADAVAEARRVFIQAGIPTYQSPEDAVNAFVQIINFRRNQVSLMEIPPSISDDFSPSTDAARKVINNVLADHRDLLTEPEAKAVLAAYQIPIVDTRVAIGVEECRTHAEVIGFPVAVKILSTDISHKSDVGGVVLSLETGEQVEAAATAMLARVKKSHPAAQIDGFTVQKMIRRPNAHELIIGTNDDPIFGPVILFGHGGTAVEVIADRVIALPPLNMTLARDAVNRTRIARLLAGYRDRAPADIESICQTLVKVSQLITDLPEVAELDINPLLADAEGVLALDARIRVEPTDESGPMRLAIRPYPKELETVLDFDGGPLTIRPIRPEDEPEHRALFTKLSPKDIRFRFFGALREPVHSELARYTQIDYDREMAFIASRDDANGNPETLGVTRVICDPNNEVGEFAIVIRSDLKGKGLGQILLSHLIEYARSRETGTIVGTVLMDNKAMLALARKNGFECEPNEQEGIYEVRLPLLAS